MEYRTLGKSGLRVSLLGLGCNNFGRRIDYAASQPVVHRALDLGITLFDTADVYRSAIGGSEEFLSRALGPRRKDVVLATKVGMPMDDGGRGASRQIIMAGVEASLRRLNTDWIDLYQQHQPDPLTPIEETLRAFDDLIQQGKVRAIGCSNFKAWQVVDARWTSRSLGLAPFVSCQDEYSLLTRRADGELVPMMQVHGMGLLPYYPLASGALTGKYRRNVAMPEGARLTVHGARYGDRFLNDTAWPVLERLGAFAQARGRTLLELAFGWLAARPCVSSIIAGATRPAQLEANVRAVDWRPTRAEMQQIDAIAAPPDRQRPTTRLAVLRQRNGGRKVRYRRFNPLRAPATERRDRAPAREERERSTPRHAPKHP